MKSSLIRIAVSAALGVGTAIALAPPSSAMYFGSYDVYMPDRRDFHTWIWSAITPCRNADNTKRTDCIGILTIPQPIAKAAYTHADATLVDGRYTMTIDDPFGLRCGDIYYGPTIPTHDVYSWDENTLAGELVSSFDVGCDGAPGGAFTYPFTLTRK
ncbi:MULTISPECIES: hypothetical protein [unclassified Mycolicibacterium]|uniref:hypothetical protein n=1 Tax=unclassified Mycolicibacterium TaxID=2636767 RepID=UPI001309EF3C|nr:MULTISPECIES: hypothetical protein [unclassified Mycolicibacterium]MUL83419.1 hypothetical protein [Mycolicibacterium sp. CBMA 329]MUL90410.1 hypothetical protein [Mycolicibacterium sp. CBMA 331]MUM00383.1 hypothetical protein [Mycolicibacterium sp. CBMA 334]MUM29786.1 hypothetical protein [Mycolicibacterium sp. CBMA 295]MUM41354.1 hypothetical protein [Mycolicibacterium sp. CBMA 247]